MVDKIPLLAQALTALQRTSGLAKAEGVAQRPGAAAQPGIREHGPSFEEQIRSRISQISADDPQRRRRALRAIVEVSLVREFGPRLEGDPAFHSLVDHVAQAIDESADMGALVESALKGLSP